MEAAMQRCSVIGSHPQVFCKKGVLRNFTTFTGKHLCQSLFFNKVAGLACNFIKKETLAQVFYCEFCEIPKNAILTEHRRWLLLFCKKMFLKFSQNVQENVPEPLF